jgi:site-specific DNA recombinase
VSGEDVLKTLPPKISPFLQEGHQWFVIEEFEKTHTQVIFLQNPFGDTPQGKLLTQMQGMIAEYERAKIAERTRRGRLEKARRGEFMPWAYRCYGYRYLPKRHGCAPQVLIEPLEAESCAPSIAPWWKSN